MVDTVRALATLQNLLADNTSEDISPQDLRDAIVSLWVNTQPLWTDVGHMQGQTVRRPDGNVYSANADIPISTGFAIGETGATWSLVVDGSGKISGVSPTHLVMVSADGTPMTSSIHENDDQVMFDKNAMFPGGTISLEGFEFSNVGGQILLRDTGTDRTFGIPSRIFTEAGGSGAFTIDSLSPVVPNPIPFQSRNDELITATEISFTIRELISALILEWQSAVEPSATGNFYLEIYRGTDINGRLIYQSHTPSQVAAGTVFTLNGGNRIHNTRSHPLLMEINEDYFIRFVSVGGPMTFGGTTTTQADVDDPTSLFTVVGQKVPAFDTLFQQFTQDRVLTDQDTVFTTEQVQDIAAAMLVDGTHNGITVTYNDDSGTIDLEVTGTTPPVTPGASVSGFSIDIPAIVALNTDLNVAQEIIFTTQQTSSITALTLVVTGGDDIALTVPSGDGSHTQSVTLTGTDTTSAGSLDFQIRGTTSAGPEIMSNVQRVTVRDAVAHEQAYVWTAATENYATQDLDAAGVLQFDVTQAGASFVVTGLQVPDGNFINILYPQNRPITSIVEPPLNIESLAEFAETVAPRTIGGQDFNGRSDQNNAGETAPFSATITVGG